MPKLLIKLHTNMCAWYKNKTTKTTVGKLCIQLDNCNISWLCLLCQSTWKWW